MISCPSRNSSERTILIAGLNRASESMALFFLERGARVTLTDPRCPDELERELARLRGLPVELCLGGWDEEAFAVCDRVILSSELSRDIEPLQLARRRQVPVTSENAFALNQINRPVVAISAGRCSDAAATFLRTMLEAAGSRVFHGGGQARALIDAVRGDTQDGMDFVLAELSGPDSNEMTGPAPRVALFTKLEEGDGLLHACDPGSLAVLNLEDPACGRFCESSPCEIRWYSGRPPGEAASGLCAGVTHEFAGVYRDRTGGVIVLSGGQRIESVPVEK